MASENNKNSLKNADTRARRQWIESALESVRLHLDVSTFQTDSAAVPESQGYDPVKAGDRESAEPARPQLYLAWSDGRRRSGT